MTPTASFGADTMGISGATLERAVIAAVRRMRSFNVGADGTEGTVGGIAVLRPQHQVAASPARARSAMTEMAARQTFERPAGVESPRGQTQRAPFRERSRANRQLDAIGTRDCDLDTEPGPEHES